MDYKQENLQCYLCFITFADPKSKARHMKKTHADIYKQQLQQNHTKFSCYKCDKFYYTSEELSEHSATHDNHDKSFQCPYCRMSFYTFREVTKHRRWDCGKRKCPCKDCGINFPNPSRLIQHRLKVHSSRVGTPMDEDLTYRCFKCNCIFQNEDELIDHQERDLDCTICDPKPPPKKRGRKPKTESRSAKTVANVCTVKKEKAELEIPCSEANCDLVFPSVDALRAHKKEAHVRSSRKLHKYLESEQTFAEAEKLTINKSKDHCSKEYVCPTCGEGFSDTSLLLDHMCSHCKQEESELIVEIV